MAGRGDAPWREELELGRRLPRTCGGPLARPDRTGQRVQRHGQPQRLVPDAAGRGGESPTSPTSSGGGGPRRDDPLQGAPRRPQPAPYLTGQVEESPRQHFFYVSDDGDLTAVRVHNWKLVFLEQRAPGTLSVWAEPFTPLRVPKMFNLRTPLRARGRHVEHLLRLGSRPRLALRAHAGLRRGDAPDLRGVPAAAEAREPSLDQVLEKLRAGIPARERPHDDRVCRRATGGGHGLGSGRHLPHRLGDPLPRGGPGPRRRGRGAPGLSNHGDERRLRGLRRRHRLHHGR